MGTLSPTASPAEMWPGAYRRVGFWITMQLRRLWRGSSSPHVPSTEYVIISRCGRGLGDSYLAAGSFGKDPNSNFGVSQQLFDIDRILKSQMNEDVMSSRALYDVGNSISKRNQCSSSTSGVMCSLFLVQKSHLLMMTSWITFSASCSVIIRHTFAMFLR